MKKTAEQKKIIRDNNMIPLFWKLIGMNENWILVANALTGEVRVLDT